MNYTYKITEWNAVLGKECIVRSGFTTWARAYGYLQNNYGDDEIAQRQLKVRQCRS